VTTSVVIYILLQEVFELRCRVLGQYFAFLLVTGFRNVKYICRLLWTPARAIPWLWQLVLPSYHIDPGSIPGQSVLDLWWTKWPWERFYFKYFCFPLSVSLHHCSMLSHLFIYHQILYYFRNGHWY
jgi:hypothetical protein